MSPYPIVSPTEEELLTEPHGTPAPVGEAPPAGPRMPKEVLAPRGHDWLAESLLELSDTRPGRRTVDFVASVAFHAIVVTILILLPLYFTEAIDLRQFSHTVLMAPPPPPPPPPAVTPVVRQAASLKRVFRSATGGIIAPTVIPEKIAILKEEPLPPDIVGVTGGVPGGVPGGQAGGVLGSILQDASRMAPPAPRPLERSAPVRVGGRVQPPRPIFTPQPIYPALAKQTKVQGDVRIDAVIDEQGNIVEMRVLSGHPLLVNAAMNAVSQWKYEPTLLNERPVAVQFVVTVQFRLTGAP